MLKISTFGCLMSAAASVPRRAKPMKKDLRHFCSFVMVLFLGSVLTMPVVAQKAKNFSKTDSDKIELFLKKSGINYLTGKGIWIVKDGETDHIFAVGEGYFVGFVVLAKKDDIKFTTESLTEMLKFNGEVDSVKIRINDKGHVEMGVDATVRLLDQKAFNDLVNQLLAATKLADARLKPFFKR